MVFKLLSNCLIYLKRLIVKTHFYWLQIAWVLHFLYERFGIWRKCIQLWPVHGLNSQAKQKKYHVSDFILEKFQPGRSKNLFFLQYFFFFGRVFTGCKEGKSSEFTLFGGVSSFLSPKLYIEAQRAENIHF